MLHGYDYNGGIELGNVDRDRAGIPAPKDPKEARVERMNELAKPKDKWKVGK